MGNRRRRGPAACLLLWFLMGFDLCCASLNHEGLALLRLREMVEADPSGALAGWDEADASPCLVFSSVRRILLAMLTVFERVGDNFISWLPMYSEAKHESEIDRNLLELRTRASDMAVVYFHKVADYSQTRFHEILQYIASQSQAQRSRSQAQQQQQRPPPPRTRTTNPAPPPVPTPSAPPMPPQPAQVPPTPPRMQAQEKGPVPVVPPGAVQPQPPSGPGAAASNGPLNTEEMAVDQSGPSTSNVPPHPTIPQDEETLIHEAIRLTRGRLRRRMAGSGPPSN